MTVADAMRSAAIKLVGRRPSAFFSASGNFEVELSDTVNDVAQEICQYRDWQALVKFHQIASLGNETEFDLPSDYDRMLLRSDLMQNDWLWGYEAVPDVNQFHYYKERGGGFFPGAWTLYDNKIHITPTAAAGAVAEFPYYSKNYATSPSGIPKAQFDNDGDTFFLPDRILTLGIVWRWRENKRLEGYEADRDKFILALDGYASRDKGSRIQTRNSSYMPSGVGVAWPYPLGG